jgi:hypothetical protein
MILWKIPMSARRRVVRSDTRKPEKYKKSKEWEVQKITAVRRVKGSMEYQVWWKGYVSHKSLMG